MLVFTTARSRYALDAGPGLLLQYPSGTPCGMPQGEWHPVSWVRGPRVGERFLCSVTPHDGGPPVLVSSGEVTWMSAALVS